MLTKPITWLQTTRIHPEPRPLFMREPATKHQSLQILYALQNEALQQTSDLLPFLSQIKLIFGRLFKSHYPVGDTQDPFSLCQAVCADKEWEIPALWLSALSVDLKTSLSSTQHIPTHITYLNIFQPHYVLNRLGIWQQCSQNHRIKVLFYKSILYIYIHIKVN